MDISNDAPITDIEDEGIAIELLDGGDDSQDYVSGTPPMTAGVKRARHMNHGSETNGQQDDYDEDVDQFTRPVLKRRRVNNTMLMPPPVSTKNFSAKGKSGGKHVIKLSSNPPNVRSESLPGAWMHDNGHGSSSGGYISIRKGKYLSSRTSASSSSTSASVSTSASASSTSASTSGSTTTSATVTASTSSQIDSRGTANGETSSGTIYE
jgi:hypothetical protein